MFDLLLVLALTAMQDSTTATTTITAVVETDTATPNTNGTAMAPGIWFTTADMTEVRSGPNHTNYPFLRVPAGTPLEVKGDAFGYAKIAATGPAFRMATGWVLVPASDVDRLVVSNDGQTGRVMERCQVMAPDLNSNNIADAFRWVAVLEDGTSVDVLKTVQTTGGGTAWRIRLPESAEGWVPRDGLRQATSGEATVFTSPGFPAALSVLPTSPLANWSKWSDQRTAWSKAIEVDAIQAAAAIERVKVEAAQAKAVAEAEARAAIEAVALAKAQAAAQAEAARLAYANDRLQSLEALVQATPIDRLDGAAAARLIDAYAQIATEEAESHPKIAHLAAFRVDQIRLASAINVEQSRINSLQAQVNRSNDDLVDESESLSTIAEYVIQGRLAVSLVFDGQSKPIMYRIEDPLSGRSLAYLAPTTSLDLSSLLGQRIGVVGSIDFDKDWHVTVVNPERVDLVSVSP
jgi:hypothetical protein